ncbi:MAG: hypothetical protein IEMM0008_1048 [bacterium]|nr:MAG: hypothetical protein IEMM0008_1048 [bacterium]
MKKIAVVGLADNWSTKRLADAVEEKTGSRYIIDMEKVYYDIEKGKIIHNGLDMASLDALIIKKVGSTYSPKLLDRLELLRLLEEKGQKIFSRPNKIIRLLDRLSCTVTLSIADIPMPPTIITEDIEKAYDTVQYFGKSVFKPLYSTKARGMMVIEANNGAKKDIQNFKTLNPVMYIQKMIAIPGKDLGITFLGGDYLGTYARIRNKGSWNTTIHSGGKYESYKPSQEMIDLAHKAQSLFGLDFTCVDMVETDDGPKIFEVSAFGGFRGLLEACDIDVAQLYTDYILRRLDHD